jgi:hypothetical protein
MAGNNCAKEDGIPQKPLSQGGALKGANAKADLARAKVLAQQEKVAKQKQQAVDVKRRRIEGLRKAAAERKAQKGERDAAEQKAAADAAAKKRAAMLQTIRVKKANERLKVVEKPASVFSGKADSASKESGETEVEFQIRRHRKDLDRLHAESEKIEAYYEAKIAQVAAEEQKLRDRLRSHEDDRTSFNSNRAEWKERQDSIKREIESSKDRLEQLDRDRNGRIHDLIGEFTKAHSGGTAVVSSDPKDYSISHRFGVSSADIDAARVGLSDAWRWLSRVASPKHAKTIARQKIDLRTGGGGSHDGDGEIVTIGASSKSTFRKTAVHEYGHAMENADARTLRALDEDFTKRANRFFSDNQGAKIMGIDSCSYYECVYKAGEMRKDLTVERLSDPSHLGYACRYSDCGYDKATRDKYPNRPRINRGTEVFSTGIEYVYKEPAAFRKRARHGFDLSILILAGVL